MKFIYFAPQIANSICGINSGITKKINDQVRQLSELNLDVRLVTMNEIISSIGLKNDKLSKFNLIKKLKIQYKIAKALTSLIKYLDDETILYLRYPYPLLFYFNIITNKKNKRKKCRLVTEHNTIELLEFKLNFPLSFPFFVLDSILGKISRQYVDAIVGVTDEITKYQIRIANDPDKPCITIGNGISVSFVKLRVPPNLSGTLNLLFVANVSRWHGIDRLLRGLALYRGGTKVRLYIVGDGPELPNIRQIVKELKLEENVVFTGILGGSALDDLFDRSHIAIGTLGIHRKGLHMASELKIREYTARGIPFICGTVDPDFPKDFCYIQKVPGDESPIDVEKIIRFAERVYLDPDHHIRMRTYAKEKLDWSVKMKELKEFCEKLCDA